MTDSSDSLAKFASQIDTQLYSSPEGVESIRLACEPLPLFSISNVHSLDGMPRPHVVKCNLDFFIPTIFDENDVNNSNYYQKVKLDGKHVINCLTKDYLKSLLFTNHGVFCPTGNNNCDNLSSPLVFSSHNYLNGYGKRTPFSLLAAFRQALMNKNKSTFISNDDSIKLMKFVCQNSSISKLRGCFNACPDLEYLIQMAVMSGFIKKSVKSENVVVPLVISSHIYCPEFDILLTVDSPIPLIVNGYVSVNKQTVELLEFGELKKQEPVLKPVSEPLPKLNLKDLGLDELLDFVDIFITKQLDDFENDYDTTEWFVEN